MYKTIVVPLDGSTFAEHALPFGLTIARRCGAALRLITVSTPLAEAYVEGLYYSAVELEEAIEGRHRTYLEATAKRIKEVTNVPVTTEVHRGQVVPCLTECGADLVIMATHGRGALGLFWLGSVADEMVREAKCPLLLIRPKDELPNLSTEPDLHRVVLALDGSEHAEHILSHAEHLAKVQMGAELVLLRAIHSVVTGEPVKDGTGAEVEGRNLLEKVQALQTKVRQDAEAYLAKVAEQFHQRGLKVRTEVVVEDDPAKAIVRVSEAMNAGLIALETHGRRGLSRLMRGSVADKVIRATHLPVLIHRSPAS